MQFYILQQQYQEGAIEIPAVTEEAQVDEVQKEKIEAEEGQKEETVEKKEKKESKALKFEQKYEEWEPSDKLKKEEVTKLTESIKIKKLRLRQPPKQEKAKQQ